MNIPENDPAVLMSLQMCDVVISLYTPSIKISIKTQFSYVSKKILSS